MNILVIAPHPDDETLGCGGAICHHVKRGDSVSAVFLTSGELGLKHLPRERAWAIREAEAKKAAAILGLGATFFLRCSDWMLGDEIPRVAGLLAPLLKQLKPKLVYLPHPQDGHPDHQAAWPILRAALKRGRLPAPNLRAYELWSPMPRYDHVENITSVMPRKLKALRAHKSQLVEFDYLGAITALNHYRGLLAAKARFAEVFLEQL
jgi:LmbE family N-acetylglucosaminyl deacetylase